MFGRHVCAPLVIVERSEILNAATGVPIATFTITSIYADDVE